MANEFDPYREALVIEHITDWPEDRYGLNTQQQQCVETVLHGNPQSATELTYVRLPTGFCRRIRVTTDDLARILGQDMTASTQGHAPEKHHG